MDAPAPASPSGLSRGGGREEGLQWECNYVSMYLADWAPAVSLPRNSTKWYLKQAGELKGSAGTRADCDTQNILSSKEEAARKGRCLSPVNGCLARLGNRCFGSPSQRTRMFHARSRTRREHKKSLCPCRCGPRVVVGCFRKTNMDATECCLLLFLIQRPTFLTPRG